MELGVRVRDSESGRGAQCVREACTFAADIPVWQVMYGKLVMNETEEMEKARGLVATRLCMAVISLTATFLTAAFLRLLCYI